MSYYFTKQVDLSFEAAVEKTTAALKEEGFGVLTEIDVKATLKKKIDVDVPKYQILGACNPGFAHKALLAEPHIGVMLPCNVVVRELDTGKIEVFAVDPAASMGAVVNADLESIAGSVREKLQKVIATL
jgi:uncharacterized protein (DUF302 family)